MLQLVQLLIRVALRPLHAPAGNMNAMRDVAACLLCV
jgi:hypothetical protein